MFWRDSSTASAVPLQTVQREENQFLIAWRQLKSKLLSHTVFYHFHIPLKEDLSDFFDILLFFHRQKLGILEKWSNYYFF